MDTVAAPSLKSNLLGDPPFREVAIYLPKSYGERSSTRYPVVYLLHGFGGGVEPFLRRIAVDRMLDSLAGTGAINEMIVVVPDANNRLTGAFFRNSPVTGRWEDFVVKDLVSYLDKHYRTVRSRRGRGIAGWSMGGYGALYIAARNPEVFSAAYALSACCLASDLPAQPQWRQRGREGLRAEAAGKMSANFNANIVTALAAIYSPNRSKDSLFVTFPWSGDSAFVVDSVARKWRRTPLDIIRRSPATRLRSVLWAFDAGDKDAFPDIPATASELHAILERKGVPHTFEIFPGTHGDRIRERLETRLLPFFSRALAQRK